MKRILIALCLSLFVLSVQAETTVYNEIHWGPRFEKGRAFEGVAFDFVTKPLYSFTNSNGGEMHHSLLLGINFLTVDNVVTNSSGEFITSPAFSFNAGLRAYNSNNNLYGDIALTYLNPDSDLSDDNIGGLFRVGYLIPYNSREDKNQMNMIDITVSYHIGHKKAEKLPSEPDLFNGLGFGVGFLF